MKLGCPGGGEDVGYSGVDVVEKSEIIAMQHVFLFKTQSLDGVYVKNNVDLQLDGFIVIMSNTT